MDLGRTVLVMSCTCVCVFPYILQKYAVLSNAIGVLRHGSVLQPLEDILVYLATEFPADLPPQQHHGRQ